TFNGTSSLSCTANAKAGFRVLVTATFTGANGLTRTHALNVTFTVTTVVAGFKLSASPTSATVNINQAATSTITVTATGGFTGSVALSETNSPATGLTCVFTPTSVTLGTSGTSTLSCNSTIAQTYTLTITGAATGAPSNSTTVTFAFVDFAIVATS